jgi:hypothetical protein
MMSHTGLGLVVMTSYSVVSYHKPQQHTHAQQRTMHTHRRPKRPNERHHG